MKYLLLSLAAILLFSTAQATPVGPMNYQGRLLDDLGIPVTGSFDFLVEIYDDPAAGVLQYAEAHMAVAVDDGVYAFKVGTQTPITGTWDVYLWQNNLNDLYLQLKVKASGAPSYETQNPRLELTSSPHAFTSTLALSLGNKTAAEFDNILQGICVSSKGKWLELVERCLGVGASLVAWDGQNETALSANSSYANLDLSGADISDVVFAGNNDFSGTVFTNATVDLGSSSDLDLSNTLWDGATSISTLNAGSVMNFTNASIRNMNLAGWNLTGSTLTGLSAAYLSACPGTAGVVGSNLPAGWVCLEQTAASGNYFLVGPGANLSSSSMLALKTEKGVVLDLDKTALSAVTDLSYVDFGGILLTQDLNVNNLNYASFVNTRIANAQIFITSLGSAVGTNFSNSEWLASFLGFWPDVNNAANMNFDGAEFRHTVVSLPGLNVVGSLDFNGTIFENSNIAYAENGTLNFNNTVLHNVYINVESDAIVINNSRVSGTLSLQSAKLNSSISNSDMYQTRLTGRFDNWTFTNNKWNHADLDGVFVSTTWSNNVLRHSRFGYDFTGASLEGAGNYTNDVVRWFGTCPSGSAPVSEDCSISW